MINNYQSAKEVSKVQKFVRLLAENGLSKASNYNMNKIITYRCKGYDLIGSSCNTRDPKRHFLINKNRYDVYELPSYKNDSAFSLTGDYLVIIKDIDFDKWYVSFMKHDFSVKNAIVRENVKFKCEGCFIYSLDNINGWTFNCICGDDNTDPSFTKCCAGFRNKKGIFDSDDIRKMAYGKSLRDVYEHFGITL